MQTGFYVATGGMMTQFNRLDIITNNLSNINTNGYKKDGDVIGTFERLYQEQRDILPLENHTKEGAKFLNRALNKVPRIVEEYTDFEQGALQKTSNPLDIALKDKNSFFVVKTNNNIMLTKDGSFSVDGESNIVTKDGSIVAGANFFKTNQGIKIDPNQDIHVDKDGMIFSGTTPVGQLMIAQVDDYRDLKKVGNNFYQMRENKPFRQIEPNNIVQSGFLEKSNVNAVGQMVGLIEANRMVGMYQKVMDSQMNDMNNDAINKLAATKG